MSLKTNKNQSTALHLKPLLDQKVAQYNQLSFIDNDPISIPHRYTVSQDIEISAFWTAMLSWGQRKTIIQKSQELFDLMDDSPYQFIRDHEERDRKRFFQFKHRTFQLDDTLYFLEFLQSHYRIHDSLEHAFVTGSTVSSVKERLEHFHNLFFSLPSAPSRTRKHVSTPVRKSSCKRLNMFLRWMVRHDQSGVDFGIWKNILPSQLMIPLDVHVLRIAYNLGLIDRKKADWHTVEQLTSQLRLLDPNDPIRYDYALFSLGVEEKNSAKQFIN